MGMRLPSSHATNRIRISVADLAWAAVSPILVLYIRDAPILGWNSADVLLGYWGVSFASSVVAFAAFRIYDGIPRYLSVHDIIAVAKAVIAGELLTGGIWFTYSRLQGIPRSDPIFHIVLLGTGLLLIRVLLRVRDGERLSTSQKRHLKSRNVILIGLNELSVLYLKFLETCSADAQRVIAILDDQPRWAGRSVSGVRVFGPATQLESLVKEFAVHGVRTDSVVIGNQREILSARILNEVRRICTQHNIALAFVDQFFGLGLAEYEPPPAVAPMVETISKLKLPGYFRFKRAIDVTGALILLTLLLPLFVFVTMLAFVDVGSPILFWQQRVGRDGRDFLLQKIRTLRPAFDWRGASVPEELRLSWFGAWLRRTRLDELPQLLHVLVGDMSLIGPRPLLPEDQPPESAIRLMVRPGITGWAQVNGGTLLSPAEKGEFDEFYVRNASFSFDLRIAWLTVRYLFRGHRHPEALPPRTRPLDAASSPDEEISYAVEPDAASALSGAAANEDSRHSILVSS